MTTQWDIEDKINGAFLEGREEGREESREETARAMLEEGFDKAVIARITKLSHEVIAAL